MEYLALRWWAGFSASSDAYVFQQNCLIPADLINNSDGHLDALLHEAVAAQDDYRTAHIERQRGAPDRTAAAYTRVYAARVALEGQLP